MLSILYLWNTLNYVNLLAQKELNFMLLGMSTYEWSIKCTYIKIIFYKYIFYVILNVIAYFFLLSLISNLQFH